MEIIKEKITTAPKLLVYGGSGTGKSTLASQMPNALFLDIEDGIKQYGFARTPVIKTLDTFYKYLLELSKQEPGEVKTIVIDSLDWLVDLIANKVSGVGYDSNGQKAQGLVALEASLSKNLMDAQGGWGKAREIVSNNIRAMLLPMLASLNQKGYAIVLIAHAYQTDVLDDDGATVEKIMPKIDPATIGKKPIAAPAFIEWVDNLFYLKKVNGERVLQVEADNYAVAKNRLGLEKAEYNLSETNIQEILGLTNKKEK